MSTTGDVSLIERAFELARSGQHANVTEVRRQLQREGYGQGMIDAHLDGRFMYEKLRSLCREASGEAKAKRKR